ncbi:hypothetical protein BT69DRAFT_1280804 [Atractiella rhizophila]|nr:hypothetical protein BT69DRAFT_1280804 [Atractiella rhizophila]
MAADDRQKSIKNMACCASEILVRLLWKKPEVPFFASPGDFRRFLEKSSLTQLLLFGLFLLTALSCKGLSWAFLGSESCVAVAFFVQVPSRAHSCELFASSRKALKQDIYLPSQQNI